MRHWLSSALLTGIVFALGCGRSEERTFSAGEKPPVREKPRMREEDDEVPDLRRQRRPFN